MVMDKKDKNRTTDVVTHISRNQILGRVRAHLKRQPGQGPEPHPVVKPVRPVQARVPDAACVSTFLTRAEAVDATTDLVADAQAVVGAIAAYASASNVPGVADDGRVVVTSTHDLIQGLPWHEAPGITRQTGPLTQAQADGSITVTGAICGLAETGSIMTASSPEHPVTLNFLAQKHIVVLTADQIVSGYEQAWSHFATLQAVGAHPLTPRCVHWITGPSRSADIALKPELGAHGPLSLHIIVMNTAA